MPAVALLLHPEHAPGTLSRALAGLSLHGVLDAWLPLAVAASLCLYAAGLLRLAARASSAGTGSRVASHFSPSDISRIPQWRWPAVSFILGWLSLVVALVGPVDEGASVLLWVHMTQHELLMLVAAPLLVLGRPLVVCLWALPLPARLGLVGLSRRTGLSRAWWLATTPLVAWALHAVALWAWHAPGPYQAAVEREWLHVIEHACFLGSAIVFWWSLVHGRHGRLGYGAAVVYVFTTAIHSSVLGALLTFSSRPWYPIYGPRGAAQGWGALPDQQMAGLLMWVPAGVVFIVLGLGLFAAWLGESERRVAFGRADSLVRAAGERER